MQGVHVKLNRDDESLYYLENGKVVFTPKYHLERGYCCGSGCRHCPYIPIGIEGNTKTKTQIYEQQQNRQGESREEATPIAKKTKLS